MGLLICAIVILGIGVLTFVATRIARVVAFLLGRR